MAVNPMLLMMALQTAPAVINAVKPTPKPQPVPPQQMNQTQQSPELQNMYRNLNRRY